MWPLLLILTTMLTTGSTWEFIANYPVIHIVWEDSWSIPLPKAPSQSTLWRIGDWVIYALAPINPWWELSFMDLTPVFSWAVTVFGLSDISEFQGKESLEMWQAFELGNYSQTWEFFIFSILGSEMWHHESLRTKKPSWIIKGRVKLT